MEILICMSKNIAIPPKIAKDISFPVSFPEDSDNENDLMSRS